MTARALAAAVALMVPAVCCAPATAGTLTVTHGSYESPGPHDTSDVYYYADLRYTAAAGERNDVAARPIAHGMDIVDSGAPVTAAAGCEQVSEHEARCTATEEETFAEVKTRDGDDHVHVKNALNMTPIYAYGGTGDDAMKLDGGGYMYGGAGADTIRGGSGYEELHGQAGSDVVVGGDGTDLLYGGGGQDRLEGGPGEDTLVGDGDHGAPAADTIDGGPGRDSVSYADHKVGVDVDLRRGDGNGQPGENDRIRSVMNVNGGQGADRLAGNGGANYLVGQPDLGRARPDILIGRGGDDTLVGNEAADLLAGGRGDDDLQGGGGADRYRGGPGDDLLDVEDSNDPLPALDCGAGNDDARLLDSRIVVGLTCERVRFNGVDVFTRLRRVSTRTVLVPVYEWDLPWEDRPCRAELALLRPRRRGGAIRLGRGMVQLRKLHTRRAHVHLTRAGVRLWRGPSRTLRLRVRVHSFYGCSPRNREKILPWGSFEIVTRVP